jgi:hypothetical protein
LLSDLWDRQADSTLRLRWLYLGFCYGLCRYLLYLPFHSPGERHQTLKGI